jgi:PHD/YefM family antitoxin component YafN of YafNO toxin-antitoxin module
MKTISATDAKNKIGELWDLADKEPVTVERNGKARYLLVPLDRYVAISKDEYKRLRGPRKAPRMGFAKDLFVGVDTAALLAVDISDEMKDYM